MLIVALFLLHLRFNSAGQGWGPSTSWNGSEPPLLPSLWLYDVSGLHPTKPLRCSPGWGHSTGRSAPPLAGLYTALLQFSTGPHLIFFTYNRMLCNIILRYLIIMKKNVRLWRMSAHWVWTFSGVCLSYMKNAAGDSCIRCFQTIQKCLPFKRGVPQTGYNVCAVSHVFVYRTSSLALARITNSFLDIFLSVFYVYATAFWSWNICTLCLVLFSFASVAF